MYAGEPRDHSLFIPVFYLFHRPEVNDAFYMQNGIFFKSTGCNFDTLRWLDVLVAACGSVGRQIHSNTQGCYTYSQNEKEITRL